MKSPARVPSAQVPVVLMAPSGASVLTPLGEMSCADAVPMVMLKARYAVTARIERMTCPDRGDYDGFIIPVRVERNHGPTAWPTSSDFSDAVEVVGSVC